MISARDKVLIRMPSNNYKVITVSENPSDVCSLGKFGSFPTFQLINQPFNATFEIYDRNKLKLLDTKEDIVG
jgi:hypothetical protein